MTTANPALDTSKTEPPSSATEPPIDVAGLTPFNAPMLETFARFLPDRPIYDMECAKLGVIRGLLKRIDTWNEGGNSFWTLVIEPGTPVFAQDNSIQTMKPFLVPVREPMTGKIVKASAGHITVPLFDPPGELISRLDNAYWSVIEVRHHPHLGDNQWLILVSSKRVRKQVT